MLCLPYAGFFFYEYEVFGQFHSLYVTVLKQTPEHIFKTWAENLGQDLQKIWFSLRKNMVVVFFSGSDKTLKVAKNLILRFCWLNIFCSSEEPPAGAPGGPLSATYE